MEGPKTSVFPLGNEVKLKAHMGGYPNDGKRIIWLKHSSNIHSFLAAPNCRNMAKDITRIDNIQYL
jgi:hypothetical protein